MDPRMGTRMGTSMGITMRNQMEHSMRVAMGNRMELSLELSFVHGCGHRANRKLSAATTRLHGEPYQPRAGFPQTAHSVTRRYECGAPRLQFPLRFRRPWPIPGRLPLKAASVEICRHE